MVRLSVLFVGLTGMTLLGVVGGASLPYYWPPVFQEASGAGTGDENQVGESPKTVKQGREKKRSGTGRTGAGSAANQADRSSRDSRKQPGGSDSKQQADSKKRWKKEELKKQLADTGIGQRSFVWGHPDFVHSNRTEFANCQACHQINQGGNDSKLQRWILMAPETKDGQNASFLGVHALEVSEALRTQLQLAENVGAIISHVVEESPAYHCGLQKHDVLIEVDESPIKGQEGLKEIVRSRKPGDKLTLELVRYGKRRTLEIVLGKHRLMRLAQPVTVKGCAAAITPSTTCQNCHSSK